MIPGFSPKTDQVARRFFPALIFGLAIVFYLAMLPKSVLPGDSGELIAASRTLSIAHPPGYPLYLMVGRLFSSVFVWGSVAYAYNLLSAIAVSAALSVLYLVLIELAVGAVVALATTLALATLQAFWLQATTAEVYAFNALFTVLLLHASLRARTCGERALPLLAFVGGLAISHHLSMVYPLLSALAILVFGLRIIPRAKTVVVSVLLLIVGLTAWLYIPLRANLGPPLVWGRTDTLSGFLSHITAQGYQWRLREFAFLARAADFLKFFRVAVSQSGIVLFVAAFVGVAANIRRVAITGALVGLVLLFAVHFAMYNIPDIESHIFPAVVGLGVLAAMGLESLVQTARRYYKQAASVLAICTFFILIPNLLLVHPRRDEWFARDYAEAIQESARQACGDSCIVITSGHLSTFPLLYLSLAQPGGVLVYDLAASNPSIIGTTQRTASIDECVTKAAAVFGMSKIAMLGPLPPSILGTKPNPCGMVHVMEKPMTACRSPADYPVRGVAADLREYSSRLLSGSYYLHVARWHAGEGDTSAVRDNVERALAAASDDVGTHINAARLCLDAGLVPQAFRVAQAALDVDPDFFEAHDLIANMLVNSGRIDEAILEYRKALKGNPSPAMVYSNLAYAYSAKRDHTSALESFNKALELDSTLVNAYIGIGRTLEMMGKAEDALAYVRRARAMDPNSLVAYRSEATLLLRMGRPQDAIDLLGHALTLEPENPLLLSDIGLCYLRLDDLDRAIAYLERALEGEPSLLTARGNLALAYQRKGMIKEAIDEYETYLEIAPPGRLKDRAREAMESLISTGYSQEP